MADAATEAVGKQDGRDPNQPNYPPLPWAGVTHYQEWAFGHPLINRPAGSDSGKPPGEIWWTTSDCDHNTVVAEILTKRYHNATVMHMIAALFAVLIEGHDPAEVRKALGLTETPASLTTPDAQP